MLTKADRNTDYSGGNYYALHPKWLYDIMAKRKTLIKELSPATRYEDALTRQEGCFVRGEKDGNPGDVILPAESAKRGHSYYLLLDVTAKNSQTLQSL